MITVKGDTACSMGRDKLAPETLERLEHVAAVKGHPRVDFRESAAANRAQREHAKHCKYCRQGCDEMPAGEEDVVVRLTGRLEESILQSEQELGCVLIDFATGVTRKGVTHGFILRLLKEGIVRVVTTPERVMMSECRLA